MSGLLSKDVEYRFGDLSMNGYFSVATQGQSIRPGVLVVHDAFGLDSHCIGVADRLATNGFAALALDLWGNRRQFSRSDDAMSTITELVNNRAMWMGRVEAARRSLAVQPGVDGARIAAIVSTV